MKQQMLFNGLQYFLLPAKPPFGSPATEIQNLAFEFWMQQWKRVFEKISPGEKPKADDFLRQDYMSVVMHGSQVVALHFYSFFDLQQKAAQAHSYFANSYTPTALKVMEEKGAKSTMSFEYFTVSPEWRNSASGISLAATLLCLGFKVFEESGADVALGVCRVDVGVAKLCYDAGGIPLDKNLTLHGVPCDLVGIFQGQQKPYKDPEENALAEYLWKTRQDFTPAPAKTVRRKKAA